ncbi:MAG: hypothetical protein JST08_01255 [Actinobacteria bacterium]|nr:hypothetical protein [Actinomycetota bacterium]
MATSEKVRRAAQDERDRLKLVKAGADLSAVGVGVISALIAPPIALVALVPGVIRYRAAKELIVQERLIEDPPRGDFALRPFPSFQASLPPPGAAVDPDLALAYRYVRDSIMLCGVEDAMITAIERAQGAELAGAGEFVDLRLGNARELALGTANMLRRLVQTQEELARMIRRLPHFALADRQTYTAFAEQPPRSSRFDASVYLQSISDGALASLFRMGASIEDLEGELEADWPVDGIEGPFLGLAAALARDSEAKLRLADALDGDAPTRIRAFA